MKTCNHPLVSVIMPVYNGEKYLADSLKSVLGQSLQNIEVVCVDDGSSDRSLEILYQWKSDDPRVVVFEQTNQGSGAARNLALQNARGKYVVFLDCDDFYPNEKTLERLYTTAEEQQVKICGGSFSRYINRVLRTDFPDDLKPYVFTEEKKIQYSDYQFDFGYHRFIYDLEFLRVNQIVFPDLKRFQDVPFMVKAMITAGEFYAFPDVTYCYRKEASRSKPIDWASIKYRDVLKGITQNFKMSREAGLARLHARCWSHFTSPEYFQTFKAALGRCNYDTIALLAPMIAEIDFALLEEGGVHDYAWIHELQQKVDACFAERDQLLLNVSETPAETDNDIAVSVVMPSLNVEPYIRLCVESVMKQTLKNIEIICIDAGSTDGTLEILQDYAKYDPRIRIIVSDQKSYGRQVNMGIDAAKGKYIAIVETDDYIPAHMYNSLYEKAVEESLEVVKGDFHVFLGDGSAQTLEYRKIVGSPDCYRRVLNGIELMNAVPCDLAASMYIWAGLYDAEFLRKNKIYCQETPGASYQDNGFWFRLLMHVQRMLFMKKPYYRLRRDNPNSSVMATNKTLAMKDEYDFIRANIEEMPEGEDKETFKKLCAYYRYKNYIFTYGRISELARLDYLKRISAEFLAIEAQGELDFSLFKSNEQKQLAEIMTDPVAYYETSSAWARSVARQSVAGRKPARNAPGKQQTSEKPSSFLRRVIGKAGSGLLYWEANGLKQTLKKTTKFVINRLHR